MAGELEKTNEPENATPRLLREMRAENDGFHAVVQQGFVEMRAFREEVGAHFDKLEFEVAAMRADQGRMASTLGELLEGQQNHGSRLNSIDGRLAIIEKRVGLVKA